jgi:thiol-disulfide isomerase/thioredoxin
MARNTVDKARAFITHPAVLLALALGAGLLLLRPSIYTVDTGTRVKSRELTTSDGPLPLFGPGVTVLNFWGETCPPCRTEAPDLTRVHRDLQGRGRGRVIGVSIDSEDLRSAKRAGRTIGIGYPVAVLDRDLQDAFGVTVLPTTYLLDDRGVVRRSFVGAVTRRTLAKAIAALE